jgi:hypothetical protein
MFESNWRSLHGTNFTVDSLALLYLSREVPDANPVAKLVNTKVILVFRSTSKETLLLLLKMHHSLPFIYVPTSSFDTHANFDESA